MQRNLPLEALRTFPFPPSSCLHWLNSSICTDLCPKSFSLGERGEPREALQVSIPTREPRPSSWHDKAFALGCHGFVSQTFVSYFLSSSSSHTLPSPVLHLSFTGSQGDLTGWDCALPSTGKHHQSSLRTHKNLYHGPFPLCTKPGPRTNSFVKRRSKREGGEGKASTYWSQWAGSNL